MKRRDFIRKTVGVAAMFGLGGAIKSELQAKSLALNSMELQPQNTPILDLFTSDSVADCTYVEYPLDPIAPEQQHSSSYMIYEERMIKARDKDYVCVPVYEIRTEIESLDECYKHYDKLDYDAYSVLFGSAMDRKVVVPNANIGYIAFNKLAGRNPVTSLSRPTHLIHPYGAVVNHNISSICNISLGKNFDYKRMLNSFGLDKSHNYGILVDARSNVFVNPVSTPTQIYKHGDKYKMFTSMGLGVLDNRNCLFVKMGSA